MPTEADPKASEQVAPSVPFVPLTTRRTWLLQFTLVIGIAYAAVIVTSWITGHFQVPNGVGSLILLVVVGCLIWVISIQLFELAFLLRQVISMLIKLSRRQDEAFRALARAISVTIADALDESIAEHRAVAGGTNRLAPRRRRRRPSSHSLPEGFAQYLAGRDDQRREQGGSR